MAWSQEFPAAAVVSERAERAWRVPMGVVSPLWAVFGAAAGAGIAYWWATQWTRAVNVEALAAAPKTRTDIAPQRIEIIVEPAAPAPVAEPEPESPPAVTVAATEAKLEAAPMAVEPAPAVVAPVAEAAPELAPAPPKPEVVKAKPEPAPELPPDDLTRMTGIGPKLSEALAARGVTRFAHIAAWTEKDLAEFDAALSLKGRAVREAWVAQAKRLAASN